MHIFILGGAPHRNPGTDPDTLRQMPHGRHPRGIQTSQGEVFKAARRLSFLHLSRAIPA
jgi:hypothetical protein